MSQRMEKLLGFQIKHNKIVIAIILLITIGFGISIKDLNVKADVSSLIPEDDDMVGLFEEYGMPRSEYLVIACESDDPFNLEGLQVLQEVTDELKSWDTIDAVISPFTQMSIDKKGRFFQMNSAAIEGRAPQNLEELEYFKLRIMSSPFANGLAISKDQNMLISYFEFTNVEDYIIFQTEAEKIIEPLYEHYDVFITGDPPFEKAAQKYLIRDLITLMSLAILFIFVIYYLGFKSIRAVILPTLVVIIGCVWTLGLMALLKFNISLVSIVTPPLVLTLGSSYSIHILNQYYRNYKDHHTEDLWIAKSVSHVSSTIIMASLTTIVGFLSLLATSLKQTREFTIATSFGIFACALLSMTFLPAVLSLLNPPSLKQHENTKKGFIAKAIEKTSKFVIKRWKLCLVLLSGIIVVGIASYPLISYESNYKDYFPKKDKALVDTNYIAEKAGGLNQLYITFTAPENESNYFTHPDILQQINAFEEKLLEYEDISYTLSFSSYLKEIYYIQEGEKIVPDNRGFILLVSNAFKAFRNSSEDYKTISTLVNDDYSRYTLIFRFYNSVENKSMNEKELEILTDSIKEDMKIMLSPELYENQRLWGTRMLFINLYKILNRDMIRSTLTAFILIFIIASINFKSMVKGLLALVPMTVGVLLNIVTMVITRIPLDITTIMVSCIAIGIGVDDSIHFLLHFNKEIETQTDRKKAITETMIATGRPIILTSVSIIGGMILLAFASFKPIAYFGVLIAAALLTTTIGCLLFLPAFLINEKRKAKMSSK